MSGVPSRRGTRQGFDAPPGRDQHSTWRILDLPGNGPGRRRRTRRRARVPRLAGGHASAAAGSWCSSRPSRRARCSWLPPTCRTRASGFTKVTPLSTTSIVRLPVFDPGGEGARVAATLLDRRGVEMRGLARAECFEPEPDRLRRAAAPRWCAEQAAQLEDAGRVRHDITTQGVTFSGWLADVGAAQRRWALNVSLGMHTSPEISRIRRL